MRGGVFGLTVVREALMVTGEIVLKIHPTCSDNKYKLKQFEKGKPSVRVGRKVSGPTILGSGTAGLVKKSISKPIPS